MQRRAFLLFVLLAVLALFYSSIAQRSMPGIAARQKAQTEAFDQLDEQVLGRAGADADSAGD
jgi:hypothetical protein